MKDIKGYEGLYAVTSCGRVWSYRSKKFLSPNKNYGTRTERAAAAKKYNVSKTAINNAIKRKGTCCGYHWRDAE